MPALPNGPGTTLAICDETITAMELDQRAQGDADYPSEAVDALVDDLMAGLEDRGYL